ncbi:MAG: hypothetical protein KF812_10245 [Fimbriimonadaceae bacterium]|nr:hypothetical protein [Fimbriimonadaceae bacterium]
MPSLCEASLPEAFKAFVSVVVLEDVRLRFGEVGPSYAEEAGGQCDVTMALFTRAIGEVVKLEARPFFKVGWKNEF